MYTERNRNVIQNVIHFVIQCDPCPARMENVKLLPVEESQSFSFQDEPPDELKDWLPRIISCELKQPDTAEIRSRCLACGERLRNLFGRAGKGMVDRTALRALVKEICNEELYRNTPSPEIVEVRQPIPTQNDLLQGFLAQVLRSLNITLNLTPNQNIVPPQPEPVEVPVCAEVHHKLSEVCELYLKEKETGRNVKPKTEKDRRNSLSLLIEYLGNDFDVGRFNRALMIDLRTNLLNHQDNNKT